MEIENTKQIGDAITSAILGLSNVTVVCKPCQGKPKTETPLITNCLGFKTCQHIKHTVSETGMNIWE